MAVAWGVRSLSRPSFARASKKGAALTLALTLALALCAALVVFLPTNGAAGLSRAGPLRSRANLKPVSLARRALCTAMKGGAAGTGVLGNPTWQQTMLRVKDGEKSVQHYQDVYGMTLLDKLDFPDMKFSLYFLATVKDGEKTPEPGTDDAHRYLWNYPGATLELTHNWGSETEEGEVYHPGNQEKDGFGHIAFACDDVYASSDSLLTQGVEFKKKPDEGRMKGLAFAYDPDRYWVEIVRREPINSPKFNLAQTMLRVKDPKKSLKFYIDHMGMTLVREKHFEEAKFSLYFLATIPEGSTEPDPSQPVLELTHNHGTEDDPSFNHFTGNEDGRKGFGHVGFLVDDVYAKCKELEEAGFEMKKGPEDGTMKGLAFALDPDGYWVEIIKRGGYDAKATPYTLS